MLLIIACGNTLRQDDGAGLLLAERLAQVCRTAGLPVRHLAVQQLLPELAVEIAAADVSEVLFVDTRVAENEEDTAVQIHPLTPQASPRSLGHQLSPEMLLVYARELYGKQMPEPPPFARQLTLPGFNFGHGDQLSQSCRTLFEEAVGQLKIPIAKSSILG